MDLTDFIPEMFSHILDWLDVIGPTGHMLLDIFLGAMVGGGSLILLVAAIKGHD